MSPEHTLSVPGILSREANHVARVLIVNADTRYSMTLGFALTARKHNVEVARSGVQGLDIGLQILPDLIIVDWMLSGHLDGLQLAEALHAVLQTTRTMMVTGFPPEEIRSEATARGVSKFLDRSIETEELLGHIDEALAMEPLPESMPLGYLQYEDNGRGRYASPGFREMFSVAPNASESGLVERLFSYYTKNDLTHSQNEWLELKKRDASSADFIGYVKRAEDGSRSLLAFSKKDEGLKDDPVVRTILGQTEAPAIPGRFIIVDENELQTRLAQGQIERSGARCHTASSMEVGLEIAKADPEANTVLLDFRTAGQLHESVHRLKEIRPNMKIAGTCTAFRKREFESAGVHAFLVKPIIASVLFKTLGDAVPG